MTPRILSLFAAATLTAHSAEIQGSVVEQASGRPMARTIIKLTPVPKPNALAKPYNTRTTLAGTFHIPNVPAGLYILTAERDHYFPASHGQRLPGGKGTPIDLAPDSSFYTELRLRRMAAITGRILDENGVGLSGIPVVAYRARLPLRPAASATSDDRGIYRVHDLTPGKYWIRTGPATLSDGTGMYPTFAPEARESSQARAFLATVDSETPDADVRPLPGQLFHLGGTVTCTNAPLGAGPINVILSSETGRRSASTLCGEAYTFNGLSPGVYEVYADLPSFAAAAFLELFLDHDTETGSLAVGPYPRLRIVGTTPTTQLTAQRQDLADSGRPIELKPPQAILQPGHWEIAARTAPGEYLDNIASNLTGVRRAQRIERPADNFDFMLGSFSSYAQLSVTVATNAGHIEGSVIAEQKTIPGIPVYLWPVNEQARRSLHGAPRTISNADGKFRFDGLPPGPYRLLATFDISEPDAEIMEAALAPTLQVPPSGVLTAQLIPWLSPY